MYNRIGPRFWIDAYAANASPERCERIAAAIKSAFPSASVNVYGGPQNRKDSAEACRRPGSNEEDRALEAPIVAIIQATP